VRDCEGRHRAGLVLDGRLHRALPGWPAKSRTSASEADGPLCLCGNRGCLATVYRNGPQLIDEIQTAYGLPITFEDMQSLAAHGDTGVRRILTDLGRTIGRPLADLAVLLNPDAIVIDARSARPLGTIVVDGVREAVDRHAPPMISEALVVRPARWATTRSCSARSRWPGNVTTRSFWGMTMTDLFGVDLPIVAAPMAGGLSRPGLIAAVTSAGGFRLPGRRVQAAGRPSRPRWPTCVPLVIPFGVNMFVPSGSPLAEAEFRRYARTIAGEGAPYGLELAGAPSCRTTTTGRPRSTAPRGSGTGGQLHVRRPSPDVVVALRRAGSRRARHGHVCRRGPSGGRRRRG